jgi:hypothetical protein
MTPEPQNEQNLDMQLEILAGRQVSLADLIAREGSGFLKGESPVPRLVQLKAEINNYIASYLSDSWGALQAVLQDMVKGDEARISRHLDQPLLALQDLLATIMQNQQLLYELVRQVDVRWGQMYGERPYFQQPGQAPHPEDEYTHESVQAKLASLLAQVQQDLLHRD